MSEYLLESPPLDGISSVCFSPKSSQFLLASSWDKNVRLYDIEVNKLKHSYQHKRPVLDCCFTDLQHCFSGGLDNQLKSYDFFSEKESVIGTHDDAIRCILNCPKYGLIVTGSWDRTIKLWDIRVQNCVGTYDQSDKIYSMDACDEKLVVGTANRKIMIWDLNNMGMPELRESSLKFQTRNIACFPNKQGYVLCSIEGRAAVEYFDMSPEVQQKKYAYKCHRLKEDEIELVYPVNAIAFNSQYNTFATGGSDCFVNVWDPFNKKRLCQFHRYSLGVTSLAFDTAGTILAIGTSYNYERGNMVDVKDRDQIYIRKVSELETKPK